MKYELNPLDCGIGRLIYFSSTVISAITCLSLIRIGCNAIEEKVKAVGVTRTVAYAFWLLGNFSDQCGDIALISSISPITFITRFWSQKTQLSSCSRTDSFCFYLKIVDVTQVGPIS